MERSSGILMHISSLPSPHGIGTLGLAAYDFARFLANAGQKYWQMLPLGPTSYGDSPYQSFGSQAGNPYFIDLDTLVADGLLLKEELSACDFGDSEEFVDYEKIYFARDGVLRKAFVRGYTRDDEKLAEFERINSDWLPDFALFMALKTHFGGKAWSEWSDEAARLREPAALEHYRVLLAEDIAFNVYKQFLFFSQWGLLKSYVNSLGIRIIGDIPIYVAFDSADVWASSENFLLDENRVPICVAGVPPDYFSATGQLWGNPVYDWKHLESTGYDWWLKRLDGVKRLFDVVRIDHFRGLESYWAIPFGETTAINGEWRKGPGMDFVNAIKAAFPEMDIIAEDLGYLTDDVRKLLADSGFPGMKVLQFAFDSREPSDYLPHTYFPHCVVYTGTHDNTTVAGWFTEAAQEDVAYAIEYLGLNDTEGKNWGFIRGALSSVAELSIAQMQDYLDLGSIYRMNTPSTLGNNWKWRIKKNALTDELAAKIARWTSMYGR